MKVAILESIIMPAGHEVEFDRILVDELKLESHEPILLVPTGFLFKYDYQTPIHYLRGGDVITYAGAGKLKKAWLSILREKRRIAWFNSAYQYIEEGKCEHLIIPTATHRYLRSLRYSKLVQTKSPITLIFHGLNKNEIEPFVKEAKRCEKYAQIKLKVISLRNDISTYDLSNVEVIPPPVFVPRQYVGNEKLSFHKPLRVGFFGQFRKEKNLAFFLDAFIQRERSIPVELIVQGATTTPEDSELFEQLRESYAAHSDIQFLHKSLNGEEWYEALANVDAIMMPYAAERYRYNWSGVLFTAIGMRKPVLCSPEINPEVLAKYKIGKTVDLTSVSAFSEQFAGFLQDITENKSMYEDMLAKANQEYSHKQLVKHILS